ncbi:MAG: response regulator [Bacteroidales bacterium]|nr:response regulator [Bacteroidales bacterium]MDD4670251.1 response regulator [Bacteroidales bacterium]
MSGKKNILVAEDNDNNYLLVSLILRNEYNVYRASNGAEALNLLKDRQFDLIFMDIMMPLMDGIEATRKIRQFDNYTPIVALTAYRHDENRRAALDAGCDDFLTKPVSKDALMETIFANLAEE